MMTITRAFHYHDDDGRRVDVQEGPAPSDLPEGMAERVIALGWAEKAAAKSKAKGGSDASE